MSTHLAIDSPHVTEFGISIRPKAEVFVNVKPEITLVDQTIFKFPIVRALLFNIHLLISIYVTKWCLLLMYRKPGSAIVWGNCP
jgi:hypothetical protein